MNRWIMTVGDLRNLLKDQPDDKPLAVMATPDVPGYYPHSYHHSRKDAEITAAYLENSGCDPHRITIVEDYWVTPWDTSRIPKN